MTIIPPKYQKIHIIPCFLLCLLLLPMFLCAEPKLRTGFMFEGSIGLGFSIIGEDLIFNTPGGASLGWGITNNIILGFHMRLAIFPILIGAACDETYNDDIDSIRDFCMFFLLPFMLPVFTHSLFGINCTYFIQDKPPSLFITTACGFSFWLDPGLGDIGLGFSIIGGAGYEFTRHHRVGCEIMYGIGKGDTTELPSQCISIMAVYTLRFF